MKRMKAPAFRAAATATLALALLSAPPPQFRSQGGPQQAPAPLAGEDPPPLTPVLDPAPREPRPEPRIASAAPLLRGRS